MELSKCGFCGVEEGKLHLKTCDYKNFNIQHKKEPFFSKVNSCDRCGKNSPDFFMVNKRVWKKIIGKTFEERDLLCKECMDFIIKVRKIKNVKFQGVFN